MFLQSETKDAIAKLEKMIQTYKTESEMLQKSCKNRYSLCGDIRDEIYPALDALMAEITKAAGKEASANVGDRAGKLNDKLDEKMLNIRMSLINMEMISDNVKRNHAEYTADQVGMTVAMMTGVPGGVVSLFSTNCSVSSVATGAAVGAGISAVNAVAGVVGTAVPVTLPLAGVVYLTSKLFQRSKNADTIRECNNACVELSESMQEFIPLRHKLDTDYRDVCFIGCATLQNIQLMIKSIPRYGLTDKSFETIEGILDSCEVLTAYINKKTN